MKINMTFVHFEINAYFARPLLYIYRGRTEYMSRSKVRLPMVSMMMPLFVVLKPPGARPPSLSLPLPLSLPLCSSLTRTESSVMASSNNVTPTNCSWWPISAMDEDGKVTDGEESQEPTIEHKPYNKDQLVLYHWTQSFSSQKVRETQHENGG